MKKTGNTMRVLEFSTTVVREGKWYLGSIDEIPGMHSQGETLSELEENLKDALALMLAARREGAARARRGKSRSLSVAIEVA